MEFVGVVIASVLLGLCVGVFSGMLGIGGGTLLVPAFKLGFALDAIACTATSLFTIIPTSLAGAFTHLRNKTCLWKLGVAAGIGGAITSPVGVWLASLSSDWAIMLAAALVIGYSSVTMFLKAMRLRPNVEGEKRVDSEGGVSCGGALGTNVPKRDTLPSVNNLAYELTNKQLVIGVLIGLAAGVISGYVGVGGGFIMVPLMIQLLRAPMKIVSGTSLIAVLILAIPGTIMQAYLGNIDWIVGVCVACGSIPGAMLGARLMARVPERTLRFIFSGFLLLAAALLIVKQLGLLG